MADTVRHHTEDMVPELQDLERRGFFSAPELKRIAAKRTDFEYLLKRRTALKADFLRYIEYEKQVEALRVLRSKSRRLQGKPSLADYAGVRRIHFIFERATRIFAGDLRMWTLWLQYCQESGSTRRISRVLTKALQLHPNAEGLWSRAAAWELRHNGNAVAARALMQRGLRMARNSSHLWVEYFKMELTYAHRLRARRRILGLDGEEAEQPAAGGEVDMEESQPGAHGKEADETEAAVQAVLAGGIARVVYRNAIAAVPDDLAFRRRFLTALAPFRFPGAETLEDDIHSSIATDFTGRPEAVDIAARRGIDSEASAAQLEAACTAFERGMQKQPSAELNDLYVAFLTEQLQLQLEAEVDAGKAGDADAAAAARAVGAALAEQLLSVYQVASDAGCASEAALLAWPALALRCGRAEVALVAARAGAALQPPSAPLRRQALVLQAQALVMQEATAATAEEQAHALKQLQQAALDAVTGLADDLAVPVWLAGLEALTAAGAPLQPLLEALPASLLGRSKGPLRGGMGEVCAAAVEAVNTTQGLHAARRLWRELAAGPSPGGALFLAAAQIEAAAVLAGDAAADVGSVKASFEAGIAAHGAEDEGLWLEFARFARAAPAAGISSSELLRRGTRTLHDPAAFVLAFKQQ